MIKYDLQAGFAGYYQSPNFSQIFDVLDLESSLYSDRLLLITGSPKPPPQQVSGSDGDTAIEEIIEGCTSKAGGVVNSSCCVEVINEESNSFVLRLTTQ